MLSASLRIIFSTVLGAMPLIAQVHEAESPLDLRRGLVLGPDTNQAQLKSNVGQGTFAISLSVVLKSPLPETSIISQWQETQGWRFLVTPDGALKFEGRTEAKKDPITVSTAPGAITPDKPHHLVLNILRDATKPNAGIWVDGVELASGVVPPVDLTPLPRLSADPQLLTIHPSAGHFRFYLREVTRPEVLAMQLAATAPNTPAPSHPKASDQGSRYTPNPEETIALVGGTDAVALAESGELEAMLLTAYPQTRFRFRNLAWEGDTVFHQDRPMNFGDLPQQLHRVNAGTVFVMFGRQECLDLGANGLEPFRAAFAKLLGLVKQSTANVVIVSPLPYEKPNPPLPDHSKLNATLKTYSQAMMEEAQKHQSLFCDVFTLAMNKQVKGLTRDGVQLQAAGAREIASLCRHELIAREPGNDAEKSDPTLLAALSEKNRLWHNYWRPTNWAFLHGDRTQQPSSRDPVNPQLRFFPAEQEKYLPLIQEAEGKAYKILEELSKKLP